MVSNFFEQVLLSLELKIKAKSKVILTVSKTKRKV